MEMVKKSINILLVFLLVTITWLSTPIFKENVANASEPVFSYNPVADSFVKNGTNAAINYGSQTSFEVKNSTGSYGRFAYVRFDITSFTYKGVQRATLKLYALSPGPVVLDVYGITDDSWSQSTMTWNTGSPNHNTDPSTYQITGVGTSAFLLDSKTINAWGQWYTIDVTSFVNDQISGLVDKNISFMIAGQSQTNTNIIFSSNESANIKPVLEVQGGVEYKATDDSYVRNGSNAGINYGTSVDVRVQNETATGNGKMGYFKFDLSNVTDSYVKRATVKLYAKSKTGGDTVHSLLGAFGASNDNWVENSINWSNSPNHFTDTDTYQISDFDSFRPTSEYISTFTVPSAGQYYEIDVTHAVAAQLALMPSNKKLTFMVAAPAGASNINYNTKESATSKPTLSITKSGNTTNYTSVADTYVRNGTYESTNFGTETTAGVSDPAASYGRIAYFRFDASAYANSTADSVILKLYAAGVVVANTINQVYIIHDTWGNSAWTDAKPVWNLNSSAHDTNPSTYRITDIDTTASVAYAANKLISGTGKYYDFEVTDFINDRLLKSDKSISFMIRAINNDGAEVVYSSSEDAGKEPLLVIEKSYLADNLTKLSDTVVDANGITYVGGTWGVLPNVQTFSQEGILTYNGYQYATYYNSNRYVCVARRQLPSGTWQIAVLTDYVLTDSDAHDNPVIGISPSDGYIHLSFDMHGHNGASNPEGDLRYRKTNQDVLSNPGSITWSASLFGAVTKQLISGIDVVRSTYPRFITKPDGNMLLTFRVGQSGNGNDILYEYNGTTQLWTSLGFYNDNTGIYAPLSSDHRNAYPDRIMYDSNGRLQATFTWREEDGGVNHDIMYIYSDDHGRTWKNNSGTLVGTTGSADLVKLGDPGLVVWSLDRSMSLINNGGMYVNNAGIVHVVGGNSDANIYFGGGNVRFHHYWRDTDGTWHKNDLNFYGARPKIVADNNNVYLIYVRYDKVCVAKATAANNYADWQIINVEGDATVKYAVGALVDFDRFKSNAILSVLAQEKPAITGDATKMHVIEYQIN